MTARLDVGDRVVFLSGPFEAMPGEVIALRDPDRVMVRLKAFGEEIVVLTLCDLLSVEDEP